MILFTPDPELIALADEENVDSAEWQTLADDVRQSAADTSAGLSDTFNARLKTALATELTPLVLSPRVDRPKVVWPRFLPRPLATAAAVAGLISLGVYLGRDSTVAWGDVVRATKKIDQCHMMVFVDKPRAADPQQRNQRLDWYYRQPDQWRIHNPSGVLFLNGKDVKFWDLEKKNFAIQFKGNVKIYGGISTGIQNGDLLTAMLSGMFQGKPPAGEPVKSDEVSAANGIDVFDFGKNTGDQWARIWVVRDSRLPIRAHVYQPKSDGFQLVDFDYSDPQPPEFFDPASFEKSAKETQSLKPHQAFQIGQRPVNGTKPRGTSQVFQTAGGYHAPEIKHLAANADGDICVIADRVRNLTPNGSQPDDEGYGQPVDTWGNRYYFSGGQSTVANNENRTWYSPVPPFVKGNGPRRITLEYTLRPDYGQDAVVLRSDTLDVPEPTADAKIFTADFAKGKPNWLRNYLSTNGTLPAKLAEIDRVLAINPNDLPTLAWRFRLLRQHDRATDAWQLFEAKLREPIIASAKTLDVYHAEAAQYLLYLNAAQRTADARALAAKFQEHLDEAERQTGNKRFDFSSLLRKEHNPLRTALAAQRWRDQFKDAPTVTQVVSPEAGYVAVEIQVPPVPEGWQSTGTTFGAPSGWFYDSMARDWNVAGKFVDPASRKVWTIYRGHGTTLTLEGKVTLAQDTYQTGPTRNDLVLAYARDVDVPKPLGKPAADWWAGLTKGKPNAAWFNAPEPTTPPAESPASALLSQAEKAPATEAVGLIDRALALPKEQWPDYLSHPANGPDAFERELSRVRVTKAARLAEAGRFDDARAVAANLWGALPQPIDYGDETQSHAAGHALAADLAVARTLLKAGDFKGVQSELDRIAPRRPNPADVPDGMKIITRGAMRSTFDARSQLRDQWRHFDELWWKARDGVK